MRRMMAALGRVNWQRVFSMAALLVVVAYVVVSAVVQHRLTGCNTRLIDSVERRSQYSADIREQETRFLVAITEFFVAIPTLRDEAKGQEALAAATTEMDDAVRLRDGYIKKQNAIQLPSLDSCRGVL